eukprot:gene23975-29021_t
MTVRLGRTDGSGTRIFDKRSRESAENHFKSFVGKALFCGWRSVGSLLAKPIIIGFEICRGNISYPLSFGELSDDAGDLGFPTYQQLTVMVAATILLVLAQWPSYGRSHAISICFPSIYTEPSPWLLSVRATEDNDSTIYDYHLPASNLFIPAVK